MELLLRNKNFRLFLMSNFFDFFGQRCTSIVLPIILYNITGNVYSTAILMLCIFLPKFLSNYFVKRINDFRFPPIDLLKYIALIRMVIFPLFLLATTQWHYYILTIIIYFSSAFTYAYRYAVIKNICAEEELPQANNMLPMLENLIMLLAPLFGGWLYSALGLAPLVLISCVCFFASFLSLRWIKAGYMPDVVQNIQDGAEVHSKTGKTFFHEFIRITKQYPFAFLLIIVDTIASISFGSLNMIMPIITQERFENSATIYSYMNSAVSLGLIVGNVIFHRRFIRANFRFTYILSTFFATTFFVLLGIWGNFIPFIVFLFLIGLFNSIQDSSLVTEIQSDMEATSDISFVFSVYQSFIAFSVVISTLLVPVVITNVGTWFLFASLGLINICGLLLLFRKSLLTA